MRLGHHQVPSGSGLGCRSIPKPLLLGADLSFAASEPDGSVIERRGSDGVEHPVLALPHGTPANFTALKHSRICSRESALRVMRAPGNGPQSGGYPKCTVFSTPSARPLGHRLRRPLNLGR